MFSSIKIMCACILYKHSSLFTTTNHSFSFKELHSLTLPYVFSPQILHHKNWTTGMNFYFVLILLIELIQFCTCEVKSLKRKKVLYRKKRYLAFPEGSSIVVNT